MALLKRKRSGLNDPMSVVTNFVNACNRHDAEGVSACLHPEFDSIQPMYPSRNFRGADQVRRNWQAIFDAEPGFRLTVLRSAAAGDTVWLELHGAGRDAEVAGVFVMGVQSERIRWARIYSALVEEAPAAEAGGTGAPATLRPVPPLPDEADWSDGSSPAAEAPPLEEDLIAPVVDIDGNGRARRGRSRRRGGDETSPPGESADSEPGDSESAESEPADSGPADSGPADSVEATSAPSGDPADSIDPEALVDAGPPVDSERGTDLAPEYDVEQLRHSDDTTGGGAVTPPEADVDEPTPGPGADVQVETMVEVDPGVVVAPDVAMDPPPEIFVEFSIPEGAVDPDPEVKVKLVVPEVPVEPEAPGEPALIVTTPAPTAPAGEAANHDQDKGRRRKPPRRG